MHFCDIRQLIELLELSIEKVSKENDETFNFYQEKFSKLNKDPSVTPTDLSALNMHDWKESLYDEYMPCKF